METCLLPFHSPYSRLAICENCVEYSQVAEKALELKGNSPILLVWMHASTCLSNECLAHQYSLTIGGLKFFSSPAPVIQRMKKPLTNTKFNSLHLVSVLELLYDVQDTIIELIL